MNIYKLKRIGPVSYDEFSGFIVVAPDGIEARAAAQAKDGTASKETTWTDSDKSTCHAIGVALVTTLEGVALHSFHAG